MKTDIDDLYEQCESSDIFNSSESYYILSEKSRYIILSAAEDTYPLAIGADENVGDRKFKVDWSGTAYIKEGVFEGDVTANYLSTSAGSIGGWTISGTKLSSDNNKLILNSKEGSITGGIITGGIIKSSDGDMTLIGNITNIPSAFWNNNTNTPLE
jgi:hypothetical protein